MHDSQFLALLLDPRPSMRSRAFVSKMSILGNPSDQTLGNTNTMRAAQRCLKAMASDLPVEGKSHAKVGNALCKYSFRCVLRTSAYRTVSEQPLAS
jgi:hypothetical protein